MGDKWNVRVRCGRTEQHRKNRKEKVKLRRRRRRENELGISEEVLGERRRRDIIVGGWAPSQVPGALSPQCPSRRSHRTWPRRLLHEHTPSFTRSYLPLFCFFLFLFLVFVSFVFYLFCIFFFYLRIIWLVEFRELVARRRHRYAGGCGGVSCNPHRWIFASEDGSLRRDQRFLLGCCLCWCQYLSNIYLFLLFLWLWHVGNGCSVHFCYVISSGNYMLRFWWK